MNIFHLKKLNQCYLTRCVIRRMEEHSKIDFRGEAKMVQMNEMRNQGKKRVKERSQNGTEV